MDKNWILNTIELGGESFVVLLVLVVILPVLIPMFLIGLLVRGVSRMVN